MTEFEKDLLTLIEKAYKAGRVEADWESGAIYATNELYSNGEKDLEKAINIFITKYNRD